MTALFCFLSGVAFVFFLLLAWSLCRAGAEADDLAERIYEHVKENPC